MEQTVMGAEQRAVDTNSQTKTTRTMLRCGTAAGPLFLVILALQALVRQEYHFMRNEPSRLSLGPWGWIQIGNFILGGLLVFVGGLGIRRVSRQRRSGYWGPLLLQVFGICEVGGGIFVVDPARSPAGMSLHGILHILFGALGFLALTIACFVLMRAFLLQKQKAWATWCGVVGLMFVASFVSAARAGQDTSSIQLFLNLIFCLAWVWVSSVSLRYLFQLQRALA